MRERIGKTILILIVAGISVVFVVSGVFPDQMGGGATGSTVVSVGSEKISARQLQQAVNQELESYRSLGMDLPEELVANIRRGTLENLVNSKLLLVEAKRVGIQASDKEVTAEIQRIPVFQDKDKKVFDVNSYKKVLEANNLTPAQFEDDVRQSLTNQRMQRFLADRIRVTPAEVEREFRISNETRGLAFRRFTRDDAMKKMVVGNEELEKFLKDPAREAQINGFYATNNLRYNQPEKVCGRHILKRFAQGAAPAADAKPPKDFLDLKPTPGNFAALAGKVSEDPGSKAKGGDLDCFGKGTMDKAFEASAFSLPLGKVSEPVQSQFGWHYILVTKKIPAVNTPIEKVKAEIAAELIKRERLDEVRKINMAAAEALAKNWSTKGLETTGTFNSLEVAIPKIGRADEILKASFDPKALIQTGPQIFESQGGVIVATVVERKSPDFSKFEKEKENLTTASRERKLRAFMPAWMDDVKSRVKVSFNNSVLEQL